MTTVDELLAELEQKADAAVPGPWDNRVPVGTIDNMAKPRFIWSEYGMLAECSGIPIDNSNLKNAEFIAAANPSTVKKLIAALRVANEALSFYADEKSWDERWQDHGYHDGYCYDLIKSIDTYDTKETNFCPTGGKRAIQSLSKIKEIFKVK